MNDYLLRILIWQKHGEILAAVRRTQVLQPVGFRFTPGNESLRRSRSFYSKGKIPMTFAPPRAVERRTS